MCQSIELMLGFIFVLFSVFDPGDKAPINYNCFVRPIHLLMHSYNTIKNWFGVDVFLCGVCVSLNALICKVMSNSKYNKRNQIYANLKKETTKKKHIECNIDDSRLRDSKNKSFIG